jgi:DNA-binding IclR family transcriptional regulator
MTVPRSGHEIGESVSDSGDFLAGPGPGPAGDIQVVARCAAVLRLFSPEHRTVRVADMGAALGLQRTTVHRYATSMANAGFLERLPDGSYGLGPLMLQLGAVALRGVRVLDIADPALKQLANEAGQTAVVAVWSGHGAVVARVHEPADRAVNVSVRVGSALPLQAAQTQVFLAFMDDPDVRSRLMSQLPHEVRRETEARLVQIRQSGYAVSSQMLQGIRGLAAPVFDGHDEICATVAVIGTVSAIPDDEGSGVVAGLLATAQRLSRELGYSGQRASAETSRMSTTFEEATL